MPRLFTAIALAALVALAPSTGASAATKDELVVKQFEVVSQDYSGIPGNFPLTTVVNWTPSGCATGGPGGAACDLIPVKIPLPDVAEADDYIVEITLEWDDESDLDMYFWDDQQLNEQEGGSGYTRLASSTSGDPGERIRVAVPKLVDYNLTILNWAGANLGYTLTAELKVFEFDPPFESLAPEFFQGDTDDDDTFVPFDHSAREPGAPEAVDSRPVPPAFGEVAISPDSDFTNFGSSSFDDELAAPAMPPAFSPRLTAGSPPDVHVAVLLFWLLIVPLAGAGAAGFFVVRRSHSIGLAPG